MNYFSLFINSLIISIILKKYLSDEEKEKKYVVTEIFAKYPYADEINYFYDDYTQNYLYAIIKLGSNDQIMEMKFDLNAYETYIVKEDIVNKKKYTPYDAEASITFNTSKRFYSQKSDFSTALLATDSLTVNNGENNIKLDKFYFAYVDEGYNKMAGSIGFNLLKTVVYPEESMNFIDQLKNNSIITGYSLTIKFDYRYKGQLLIGPDIEDIIPNEMDKYTKHVVKTDGYAMINDGKWEINLNKVIVGESELLKSKKVKFDLKYDFIIATDEYSEFIFKNFFSSLFGTGKCIREELPSFRYYLGIKCEKNVNIADFPNLIFDMPTDFEKFHLILNYEDLFEEFGDYKYFKIIITYNDIPSISINDDWIFGKQFFQSYLVTFNKDRKDINIYTQEKKGKKEDEGSNDKSKEDNNNESKEGNNSDTKKSKKTLWILIGILILMAVIIAYLIVIFVKQSKIIKKKSRLNILEDELDDEKIN